MEVDEAGGPAEKTAGNTDIDSGIENMEVSGRLKETAASLVWLWDDVFCFDFFELDPFYGIFVLGDIFAGSAQCVPSSLTKEVHGFIACHFVFVMVSRVILLIETKVMITKFRLNKLK